MSDPSRLKLVPQTAARMRWPVMLSAIVMSIAAGGIWLLASTSGLRWASATAVSGMVLEGVGGTLLGPISAKTLVIDNGKDLRITARDVRLEWRPLALLRGKLEITALAARDVEVLSLPSPYPQSLLLPLPLSVRKLDIGALRVLGKEGGTPDFSARNLAARLESDGRLHKVQNLHASLEYGQLSASAQLDGNRPFAVQARVDLSGLTDFTGAEEKKAHISAVVSGDLKRLTVKVKGSGAGLAGEAEAQLAPYADFPLAALRLQVSGLNPRAFSPDAPNANFTLQADLHGNAAGRLEGNVDAKNIAPAPLDRGGLPLLAAHSRMLLSADLLQFNELALTLAGGASLSGHFAWQRGRATGSADMTISRLDPAALDTRLRAARLNGSMKISGDQAAQKGVLVLGDGTLHLDAHLARAGDTLTLDRLLLARGDAALSGQGKMELGGRRAYSFSGQLQRFDLSAFMRAPHSDLNATLDLGGELEPQTAGTLRFSLGDSRLADQPVDGGGQIEFVGMGSGRGEAELRLGDNRLSAKGGWGAATDKLQLDLAAPALAQLGPGFGGTLDAHATLTGKLAQADATLQAEGRELVLFGDHRLDSVSAAASLHGDALTLTVNAADYRSDEEILMQGLQLSVHGSRAHHDLDAQMQLNNGSKFALHGNGGFSDPANGWGNIQWQGVLTELSGTGVLPFKLLADMPLALARNHVALDAADFAVAGGQVYLDSAAWTPQRWGSSGSFSGIGLRAGIGLRPDFTLRENQPALRLGGAWNITSAEQLSGSLHVARESGDWALPGNQSASLGLQALNFIASADHGRLSGELTASGERLGNWRASIAMPLTRSGAVWTVSDDAPLHGQMRIKVPDLSWVGPAMNDSLKSGGRMALEADVTGTFGAPRLRGQVNGDDLVLAFLDQGVRLQQGQFAARFDQNEVHIDTLSFSAPHEPQPRDALLGGLNLAREPGKLSASGTVDLAGKNGDLEISATRLPLAQRADRWVIVSGSGHASLRKNTLALVGNIVADAGLISQPISDRPQLPDDVVITGQQIAVRKGPRLTVDATLDLGEHFYLRASGLEARLDGQLSARESPGQQLRVTGSIAARDASFEAYGQLLTVERGIVNFQGPLYDPGLNILALRKGLSVEAGVEVTGTALHPEVRLVSTPVVPDSEKLSWIVLGRAPDAGGIDSTMLLSAAGSILGGRSGGVTGQIKQSLGVDELSLRQAGTADSPGGQTAQDNPLSSQIITVGKRLSARAFISYEQGVTAAAGVTKLTYTLTPRINIVTQAGVDNAIDVFYTFSFD